MEELTPEEQADLDAHLIARDKADAERAARQKRLGPCAVWETQHNIVGDDGREYLSLTVVLPRPAPQETVEKIARAVADAAGWDAATAKEWIAEFVGSFKRNPDDLPF